MKSNIILLCLILFNSFLEILSFLKGVPCRYSWLFLAEIMNIILCIIVIIFEEKIKRLKEQLNDRK